MTSIASRTASASCPMTALTDAAAAHAAVRSRPPQPSSATEVTAPSAPPAPSPSPLAASPSASSPGAPTPSTTSSTSMGASASLASPSACAAAREPCRLQAAAPPPAAARGAAQVPLTQAVPASSKSAPTTKWSFSRQGHWLVPTRPFCVEICAGSGRLTAALRQAGLDAWAVDHKAGRLQSETPAMLMFDIAEQNDSRHFAACCSIRC